MKTLPLEWHAGHCDDGDRKDDEDNVCKDVGDTHGHQLGITLAAVWAWIGNDLPIMGEGLTLGEGCDDDADKGEGEVPADDLEGGLIRPFPYSRVDAF